MLCVSLFLCRFPFASTAPTNGTLLVIPFTPNWGLWLICTINQVPPASSFYVSTLPDLHQDPLHPLHIYAGHLNADPDLARLPDTTVTPHLYFVLIKARRTADKERILFWFNVSSAYMSSVSSP